MMKGLAHTECKNLTELFSVASNVPTVMTFITKEYGAYVMIFLTAFTSLEASSFLVRMCAK